MEPIHHLLAVGCLLLFTFGYILLDNMRGKFAQEVTFDNGKLALDRLKDWATWITGLQTAAMAVMGLLAKGNTGILLTDNQKWSGFWALLFFGVSVILTTWILSSLPSVQQRLFAAPSKKNDVFEQNIFSHIPFRLGRFFGIMHTYCLIGFIFFSLFIYFTIYQHDDRTNPRFTKNASWQP